MQKKKCTECGKMKPLHEFPKNKNEKDGFHYRCKDCYKEYYKDNKKYRIAHTKEWRTKNKEHLKRYNKKYKTEHKEEITIRRRQYNLENKERIAKVTKAYKDTNKVALKEYSKIYAKNNKNKIRAYVLHRFKTDLNFKLRNYLRSRVRSALVGNPKLETSINLVGCSMDFLKQHLEKQFKKGMSWNNYGLGGWEIDHIIPCIKFDMTKLEEQKKCFHYTNLQPLWASENRQKNSRS